MRKSSILNLPARRIWLVLGFGLVLGMAPGLHAEDPKDLEIKGDMKAIQGTWISKDDMGESTWIFKGDKLSLKTPTRAYEMTIKLDPDSKPERAIDFKVLETSPDAKNTKADGIYKIDGDKLQICFGGQEAGRPKKFQMDFPDSFLFELKQK